MLAPYFMASVTQQARDIQMKIPPSDLQEAKKKKLEICIIFADRLDETPLSWNPQTQKLSCDTDSVVIRYAVMYLGFVALASMQVR